MDKNSDSQPSRPLRQAEPGTSIFFTASLLAVVINIALIVILEMSLQQSASASVAIEYYLTIYTLAALLGVRHLLRITVVDLYFQKRLLPEHNKGLYWLILVGTILGAVSLTATIAGLSWYLFVLFPYLGLFSYFGIKISSEVKKFSKADVSNIFWTVLSDGICAVAIYELYQVLTQQQSELGFGFAIIIIVGLFILFKEMSRVYSEPVKARLSTTKDMLFS